MSSTVSPDSNACQGVAMQAPHLIMGAWVDAEERGPHALLVWLTTLPKRLWEARDLVVTSVLRDLQVRFKGSRLGFLWTLVQPLFLFLVYGFLFARLLGLRMPGLAVTSDASFGIYLFLGALVWTSIGDSLQRSASCVEAG